MSSRLHRMWLLPFLLLGTEAWALGLGDIRLSSALNQPLRAEIELLAATPEELTNLTIQLASADTFARYDLDRPLFLTRLDFDIVSSGRADGNIVRITSSEPISEPFVTFLVEASWTRGRLLREYTLLLDPPTFAPPAASQPSQPVNAPTRAAPADAGQIQRPAPQVAQVAPRAAPRTQSAPQNSGQLQDSSGTDQAGSNQAIFDATPGGEVLVQRGDTLWGIASRVRSDSRLTVNQTMLAIYQANPEAFAGNINLLRAGASLRIPSADNVFRISRGEAIAEVARQNNAWGGVPGVAPVDTQPSLTLVPPDEEIVSDEPDVAIADIVPEVVPDVVQDDIDLSLDPATRIDEISAILNDQNALLEISDNELASLRNELAALGGEDPIADTVDQLPTDPADDIFVDDDVAATDEPAVEIETEEPAVAPPAVVAPPVQEQGLLDTVKGYLGNVFVVIGAALLAAVLLLVWFMRRAANKDNEEATGVWTALDADDLPGDTGPSTEQLQTLPRDNEESIVVVEAGQTAEAGDFMVDTIETPAAVQPMDAPDPAAQTGINRSIEETFSSETAINLDQSDPVAEADFHMAYGLYDQAADLITGALNADPEREDLLAKLCEIYFVWGNRDAFVEAAGRMKSVAGGSGNPDWDKIVIMGQQIAGDHQLFSGASAEGVTKAVDLSFDASEDDGGALDIDFDGGDMDGGGDIIDLGAHTGESDDTGQVSIAPDAGGDIDFSFDAEASADIADTGDIEASITREMPASANDDATVDAAFDGVTAEMPVADESAATAESPTVEEQFAMDATGELPAIEDTDIELPAADSTAEINLDDLGLDLGSLDADDIATDIVNDDLLGDLDDTTESQTLRVAEELEETGRNPALDNADSLAVTGTNEAAAFDDDETGSPEALNVEDMLDIEDALAATGEMPSMDGGTGIMPALGDDEATLLASLDNDDDDIGIDTSLLDATGQTQILTGDMAVSTGVNPALGVGDHDETVASSNFDDVDGDNTVALSDDAATMLAPLDDDEFDFAKTEALPKDVFSSDLTTDETGRMQALAGGTDMDLDLDDLTAALRVSEVGDTVNQMRDDATVEQPRINPTDRSGETGVTQALAPEDMSGDLHEARTMTEVGTKLDLARAYVDMGDPSGARSILEEVIDEGDEGQKQQAQQLLDSLPS